jgi:phospholipid-binding lipoprotein MlaA
MKNSAFKITLATLCLSLTLGISACAKSQNPDVASKSQEIADPIEPVNRFIFGFNDILDRALIEPIAKGYKALLPGFARDGIQNFMHNLKSPLIIANNLLQGQVGDAGVATARFVINSTIGVVGLVDVAQAQGLPYKDEDFGQTLAVWGAGDGFYLVLPVLGPSSLRDATGLAVDSYADPVRIIAENTGNDWIYYTREIVEGIDTRSRLIKAVDDLRNNNLDYYAAVKSAYTQKRQSLIRNDKPGTAPKTPNYYDESQ